MPSEENRVSEDNEFGIDWDAMTRMANGEEDEPFISGMAPVITEQVVRKQALWDVAPHNRVAEIAAYLGLPGVSEEGLQNEHQEAHERGAAVYTILQPLALVSGEVARAVVGTMMVTNGISDVSPVDGEEFTDTVDKLETMIVQSSAAVISQLIDWDLLHLPIFITQEQYDELAEQQEEDETP